MKTLLIVLLACLFPFNFLAFAQQAPAAVAPVSAVGGFSDKDKNLFLNELEKEFSNDYELVSRTLYEEARERAYEELDFEECTEEQCRQKIQEFLQVERLFTLQILRSEQENFSQITLTLNFPDEKLVAGERCESCDIKQLLDAVKRLADEIVAKDQGRRQVGQSQDLLSQIEEALRVHASSDPTAGRLIQEYLSEHDTPALRKNLKLSPEASFNLGIIYRKGYGLSKNDVEALIWYRKSAEAGHVKAQTNLGFMFFEGLGVPQDYGAAKRWYERAASAGNAQAQYNLASMYWNGIGLDKNQDQARQLFKEASNNGHSMAKRVLEKIGD